jgi:electron transfer flavoprotein alpha subunit
VADILVVAEHRDGNLAEASLEMLSEGKRLAEQAGCGLLAVVVTRDVSAFAPRLARWADTVLAVKSEKLEHSLAEPYQRALAPLIRERRPRLVLLAHSSFGMDLAPALAVEVSAPLATDCTNIAMENGAIIVTRSIYNGKVNALYSFAPCETAIVTGRPGVFAVEEGRGRGIVEEVDLHVDEEVEYKRFEGCSEPEVSEVDITKADVLVAVGRGMKEKGNLQLAEDLAGALGGVLACSRPVVDYGWLPAGHQVGLSGKTVKPTLYLALGISGAFQHMVGLRGSKIVVAINKDEKAPIFTDADYGIVGDLLQVVPILVKKVSELKR